MRARVLGGVARVQAREGSREAAKGGARVPNRLPHPPRLLVPRPPQVDQATRADREGRGRRAAGLQRSAESEQLVNGREGARGAALEDPCSPASGHMQGRGASGTAAMWMRRLCCKLRSAACCLPSRTRAAPAAAPAGSGTDSDAAHSGSEDEGEEDYDSGGWLPFA